MKAKKFTTYNQRWSNARIENGTKGPQPGRIKTKKYKDSIKHDKTSPGAFWRPYIGEPSKHVSLPQDATGKWLRQLGFILTSGTPAAVPLLSKTIPEAAFPVEEGEQKN